MIGDRREGLLHPARPRSGQSGRVSSPEGEYIGGDVAAGFGAVADAFRSNFRTRGEVGAAVAVYRDDEKVVDLWGGWRDRQRSRRWEVGHVGARVLDDEGDGGRSDGGCPFEGPVPARRARRLVLARVRTTRQGERDGAATPGARSRPRSDRPTSRSGHDRRSRIAGCGPRRASAEVAAGNGARLPRTDARVVREPTVAAGRPSPQTNWHVLRRRSCSSPRCRVLHRGDRRRTSGAAGHVLRRWTSRRSRCMRISCPNGFCWACSTRGA